MEYICIICQETTMLPYIKYRLDICHYVICYNCKDVKSNGSIKCGCGNHDHIVGLSIKNEMIQEAHKILPICIRHEMERYLIEKKA